MRRAVSFLLVVTGTWALNFVYKDGTHTQGYCTFHQDGTKLTGACGPETTGGARLAGEITNSELDVEGRGWRCRTRRRSTSDGTFMKGAFSRQRRRHLHRDEERPLASFVHFAPPDVLPYRDRRAGSLVAPPVLRKAG